MVREDAQGGVGEQAIRTVAPSSGPRWVKVVRAGVLDRDDARRSAGRARDDTGVLSLSVFAAVDRDVDELCAGDRDLCRYRQIRNSTFGRLRRAGFALLASFGRPPLRHRPARSRRRHHARLEGGFDPARPNPGFRPVRSR